MGELFQEHKRFFVTLILGALAFFVLYLVIGAFFDSSTMRARNEIRKARGDIERSLPAGVDLQKLRVQRDQADTALRELTAALHRVPAPGFQLTAEVRDPDLHYNRIADGLRRGLVEACAVRSVDVDMRLGLPDSIPTTRRDIDWYLRGLDVVQQVLESVIRIDTSVLESGIARIERIEIAGQGKAKIGGGTAAPAFVVKHPVSFVIVGHPRAIFSLTEEYSRPLPVGRGLVVEEATIRSLDLPPGAANRGVRAGDPLDRGRVELKLTVAAVDIQRDGAAEPEGKTP